MKKIVVLGCGRVGSAIVKDLANDFEVLACDFDRKALDKLPEENIETQKVDLSKASNIKSICESADIVVSAVPGFMGFETLRNIINSGKNVVDISFFPEDPFELDELARKKEVTAIVDCGVAPGMDNVILGYHDARMKVDSFKCMVGGLPAKPEWPFEYKAPFSPIDVIEEYTRPARIRVDGEEIVKDALTDIEEINLEGMDLEAFNSDGLRTLLRTMDAPNMVEKTIRYRGHAMKMKLLRDAGFFDQQLKEIDGKMIKPIDLTADLLFKHWNLEDGEEEFTIMEIHIEGEGRKINYLLLDRYDAETNTSSMARTTGYACTAAVNLIANEQFNQTGIIPPEYLGREEEDFRFIMNYLEERGVQYKKTEA